VAVTEFQDQQQIVDYLRKSGFLVHDEDAAHRLAALDTLDSEASSVAERPTS
jgi:hypothetical protein